MLDGTKKLFFGSEIGVSCILENDLPDTLKMSEARKRDAVSAVSAAKKAAASKSGIDADSRIPVVVGSIPVGVYLIIDANRLPFV